MHDKRRRKDDDLNEKTHGLVEQAMKGDEEAIGALYHLYKARLEALIRVKLSKRLKSRIETSDLIQSVWKDVLTGIDHLDHGGAGLEGDLGAANLAGAVGGLEVCGGRSEQGGGRDRERAHGFIPSVAGAFATVGVGSLTCTCCRVRPTAGSSTSSTGLG